MMVLKIVGVILIIGCSCVTGLCGAQDWVTLTGSTPGDEPVKSMLSISTTQTVDFIKWRLTLNINSTFQLKVTYGESQPNTLGFISGGQTRNYEGSYSIQKSTGKKFKEIYTLKSRGFGETISLIRLNENIFHFLTSQHNLMVGNGGWSYSLNRVSQVPPGKILISSDVTEDNVPQLVFDGRTPCSEISAEHPEMNASSDCFKLKWKLILNRDSITHAPTTCVIRKVVDNQPRDITGKWTIIQGTKENPDVVIYKIETVSGTPILLLAGDDHVLFFLDKNRNPFVGNENFSFALNRRTNK